MPVTGMVSQAARQPVAVIYPANSKEIRFGSYITTYASTDKRIFGRSIAKGVVFRRIGPVQASHRQIGQLCLFIFNKGDPIGIDRKSTRLNSSHVAISYAVFCLQEENKYEP